MAKIFIREMRSACCEGDYFRDEYKRYYKAVKADRYAYYYNHYNGLTFQATKDPTENLLRKEGSDPGFGRSIVVLCRIADMRPGCLRTGSSSKADAARWKTGSAELSRIVGFYGGGGYNADGYAYCAPGDVMAFDAETTVTTLSAKRGDHVTKDAKHGQTFTLDSGELVYLVTKPGFKLPAGKGWALCQEWSVPGAHSVMWSVQGAGYQAFNSDVAPMRLVTGYVAPEETLMLKVQANTGVVDAAIAILDAAEKDAKADIGRFIVWSPGSTLPVTTEYTSGKQASAVAASMAGKHKGQTFITARLVEEFTEEKPVQTTLRRVKL